MWRNSRRIQSWNWPSISWEMKYLCDIKEPIGSPKCSKKSQVWELFLYFMMKKMCLVQKQTESGWEIAFYYSSQFQWLVLKVQLCKYIIFEYFHSVPVSLQTVMIIWDFQFIYSSLMAHLGELVRFVKVN